MIKNISFFFVLFSANILFAQKDTTFFNADWEKCAKAGAVYFRIIEKQGDKYLIKDMFIKTNAPQMVAYCDNSTDELMKDGKCTYYSENGQKDEEGFYKQNKKSGIWITWYEEGKDSSITKYNEDETKEYIRIAKHQSSSPDGEVYTIVEEMPAFPGGMDAMFAFIRKNIKYPKKEKKKGISGTCYISFVVDKDGSITNAYVLRGIPDGAGYDAEALRVVKMMPNWYPGTQNGKRVKVQYNLPIKFTL